MALRQVQLAQQIDGINLMRSKGGASPSSLFDLKNGWVTSKRTLKARPGSVAAVTFPAGSVGDAGFEGKHHTFAHKPLAVTDPQVVLNVLLHPSGGTAALMTIHRAFPFLGRLYVVAEFADNVVQHYWLENPPARADATAYSYGAVVQPAAQTGYYYELLTRATDPAWQANTEVAVDDVRQPSIANGFRYTVTAVTGDAPIRTGNTEPAWPTVAGATVLERRFVTAAQVPPGSGLPAPGGGAGGTGTGNDSGGGGGGGWAEYGPFPPTAAQ